MELAALPLFFSVLGEGRGVWSAPIWDAGGAKDATCNSGDITCGVKNPPES